MRRGEILSLRWRDIDFEHDRIVVQAFNSRATLQVINFLGRAEGYSLTANVSERVEFNASLYQSHYECDLRRRRIRAETPARPVLKSRIVIGSGMGAPTGAASPFKTKPLPTCPMSVAVPVDRLIV